MATKKKIFAKLTCIVFLILLVSAIGGYFYLNGLMNQPLYKFGSVRNETNLRGPLQPPEQKARNSWLVEDDITLAFNAYGHGEPVLVVHGGPGIPYPGLWKGLESLTENSRFYFYHQRGCGNSSRPIKRLEMDYYSNMMELDRSLGIGAQVADIERIRRILGVEKITIIGHSFGGFLATVYAAEFPERVDKLVLVAPAGVLTPPSKETDIFSLTRERLDKKYIDDFDAVKDKYFDFGNIFSKTDDELVQLHMNMGKYILQSMDYSPEDFNGGPRSGGWAVFALYFSGGRRPNFLPLLDKVTAPTLILHGADDEIALAGSKSYLAIPNSKFVTIKREHTNRLAGHMIFDDCPKRFGNEVEGFLANSKN